MGFRIEELSDGSLVLSCGNSGMETDLVFASGAMRGDPLLGRQREILEYIVKSVEVRKAHEYLDGSIDRVNLSEACKLIIRKAAERRQEIFDSVEK